MLQTDERTVRFQRAIEVLQDHEATFTAELVYALSDLSGPQLETFRSVWATQPDARREALIALLVETGETNFELDFSSIIHPALRDDHIGVRKAALEGVFEDSPRPIIETIMSIAQEDTFSEVRATATKVLGQFVLQGELGKLAQPLNLRLQDTVLALHRNLNEDIDVRRRALEAIGNCGREGVKELIREAYYADELPMRVSALYAMGRSCDEDWSPQVLEELNSEYEEMRYEAARTAGELGLHRALPRLAEMAFGGDREIQIMAIWAIGEIGGNQADAVLSQLEALAEEAEDSDLLEAVAEAQNAALLAGEDPLPLMDFSGLDGLELDDDDDDEDLIALDELELDDDDDEDDSYSDYDDYD